MIGFRRGVWLSALHLGATLFSLWVAQRFYLQISQRLELFIPFPKTQAYDLNYAFQFDNLQQRFDHIIAFLIVATITKMLCYGVIVVFDKVIQYQGLNLISRFIGMLMGIISSIIICTTLLYSASTLSIRIYPTATLKLDDCRIYVITYYLCIDIRIKHIVSIIFVKYIDF
ncbi:CvpA family protein [Staphylococcus sp. 2S1]